MYIILHLFQPFRFSFSLCGPKVAILVFQDDFNRLIMDFPASTAVQEIARRLEKRKKGAPGSDKKRYQFSRLSGTQQE